MIASLKHLIFGLLTLTNIYSTLASHGHAIPPIDDLEPDTISLDTRQYWMRRATAILLELNDSPCPFEAFGAVIVNHTDTTSEWGVLVCSGVNRVGTGNPVLHGEFCFYIEN